MNMASMNCKENQDKRDRKPNFSTLEVQTILAEVAAERTVLFSKLQNKITVKEKEKVWKNITDKVKACGVADRTVNEVKVKFKALKKANWTNPPKARKATGGGRCEIAAPYEDLMGQIIGDDSDLRNGIQVQGVETGFTEENGMVNLEVEVHHSTPRKNFLDCTGNGIADVNDVNGADPHGEITVILGPDGEAEIPVLYKQVSDNGTESHVRQDQGQNQHAIKDSQLEFQTLSSGLQTENGIESDLHAVQTATVSSIVGVEPGPSAPQGSGFKSWSRGRQGSRRMPVQKRRLPAESSGDEEYNKIMKSWADSTIRLQEEQLKLARQQRLKNDLEILKLKKDLGCEVSQESIAAVLKEYTHN